MDAISSPVSAAAAGARESARQDNGQFGTQPRTEVDVALGTDQAPELVSRRGAVDSARLTQRELSRELDAQMNGYADLLHTVDTVEDVIDQDGDFPSNGRYLVLSGVVPRDLRYRAVVVTSDGEQRELRAATVIFMTHSQVVPTRLRANTDEMTGPYAGVLIGRDDHVIDMDKYRALDLQAEADQHHAQVARIALGKTDVIAPAETAADVRDAIADQLRDESFENESMVVMTAEDRSEAARRVLAERARFSRIFHEDGYQAYTDEIRSTMRDVFHERYDEDELWERHENGEL